MAASNWRDMEPSSEVYDYNLVPEHTTKGQSDGNTLNNLSRVLEKSTYFDVATCIAREDGAEPIHQSIQLVRRKSEERHYLFLVWTESDLPSFSLSGYEIAEEKTAVDVDSHGTLWTILSLETSRLSLQDDQLEVCLRVPIGGSGWSQQGSSTRQLLHIHLLSYTTIYLVLIPHDDIC
ncbi:hypothetical protein ASPZODRAFT_164775 [Penicilliopsis zonata CBS 506.65]|uniref:Uncharacterized protein n=1 Tax=Penicilliopsis zonata CBS 506.65 TaxID=1073090 RepID=A0A1L9SPN3_9EURO|nr:hypothetical protein ASPZODRAFT_164775 [Penicilliopsis zonata CBS 506.65]OJJ49222.1 hypothetical protein ASPZODRAFT_164775 [Penicilliopsis zonata CBS 506.65]